MMSIQTSAARHQGNGYTWGLAIQRPLQGIGRGGVRRAPTFAQLTDQLRELLWLAIHSSFHFTLRARTVSVSARISLNGPRYMACSVDTGVWPPSG